MCDTCRYLGVGGGDLHANRALAVGPPDSTAAGVQHVEYFPSRVTIRVVASYGDERQRRAGCEQEARVARCTAMVGNLQEPGSEPVRFGEQVVLSRTFHVAGQQRDSPAPGGTKHDRRVVRLALRPAVGTTGGWSQHLQAQSGDRRGSACYRVRNGDSSSARLGEQPGDARKVAWQSRQPNCSDPRLSEHGRETIGVVGVGVAENDKVEPSLARSA